MKAVPTDGPRSVLRQAGIVILFLVFLPLPGCIAQQPDLKQTEKTLQQRIKQSSEESAQTRARQSQEISMLREEELPKLQGKLDQVSHQAQELQGEQEDLKQRSSKLEQRMINLEQFVGKAEKPVESGTNPQGKDIEARLDTHDEVISSLLVQIADLSKRLKAIEKK